MPDQVPLRVDFAGGWLDVPALARPGAFVVNCAISPCVSLKDWPYQFGGGLGGSAAKAILEGKDAIAEELLSAGWQDPAVILETGLCVWRSGPRPVLDAKVNPDFLRGKMALIWTGQAHVTHTILGRARNYARLEAAGFLAADGARQSDISLLGRGVECNYSIQLDEGMLPLPHYQNVVAKKYCGSGHGGYALYLFRTERDRDSFCTLFGDEYQVFYIEPFLKQI